MESMISTALSTERTARRRGGLWGWGRRWCRLGGLLLLLGAGASAVVAEETKALSAGQLKAAFILDFPQYVEWPTNRFAAGDTPIIVGVLGDEKLSAELERMGGDKKINGRAVVIRRVTPEESPDGWHILYVAAAQAQRAPELLARLQGRSVLTVGESEDFLERGGMVNLVRKERKYALEINLAPATAAQLKISSKLLSVATVKGRPN
jgi:hypothetical protein